MVFAFALAVRSLVASAEESVEKHFEERVRPILVDRCQKCHAGPKAKAGLRLDSADGLRRGGASGPVLAQRVEESRLLQAVRHENGLKMPPDGKLDGRQVADLVAWVKAGAIWPKSNSPTENSGAGNREDAAGRHWSFRSVGPVDQPIAALIRDMKQRGLLDESLIAICTEFGRTPTTFNGQGREHYVNVFTSLIGQRSVDAFRRGIGFQPVNRFDKSTGWKPIPHGCGAKA